MKTLETRLAIVRKRLEIITKRLALSLVLVLTLANQVRAEKVTIVSTDTQQYWVNQMVNIEAGEVTWNKSKAKIVAKTTIEPVGEAPIVMYIVEAENDNSLYFMAIEGGK